MIDKQKIREKYLNLQGLSVNKGEVGKRIQKATFNAMDELSKLTAIDFAKWLDERKVNADREFNQPRNATTEELFELYLLQSTKQ